MTTQLLLEILVFVFGTGTLGSLILFFKANKKLKNAEADKATAEARLASAQADKGVIDNYEMLIERYEKLSAASEKRYEDFKSTTDDKITFLEGKVKEIEERQKANQKFMCYKIDCNIRERRLKS